MLFIDKMTYATTQCTTQINDVLTYLNSFSSMSAQFSQIIYYTNHSNEKLLNKTDISGGNLFFVKPNKLKIDYNSGKINATIVVDQKIATYFDKKLEQISHIDSSKLLTKILLKDKISFEQLNILKCELNDEKILIVAENKTNEENEYFVLTFTNNPIEIFSITIHYSNNEIFSTVFSIFEKKYNINIPNSEFIIKDPRLFRHMD